MKQKLKLGLVVWGVLLVMQFAAHAQSAPAAGQDSKGQTVDVKIDNFSFSPATITIPAGTTVKWTNRDDIPHTVVSDASPPLFRSKALDTDDSFAMVFDKPGTYHYFCGLHPHMTGTIVVQ